MWYRYKTDLERLDKLCAKSTSTKSSSLVEGLICWSQEKLDANANEKTLEETERRKKIENIKRRWDFVLMEQHHLWCTETLLQKLVGDELEIKHPDQVRWLKDFDEGYKIGIRGEEDKSSTAGRSDGCKQGVIAALRARIIILGVLQTEKQKPQSETLKTTDGVAEATDKRGDGPKGSKKVYTERIDILRQIFSRGTGLDKLKIDELTVDRLKESSAKTADILKDLEPETDGEQGMGEVKMAFRELYDAAFRRPFWSKEKRVGFHNICKVIEVLRHRKTSVGEDED